MSCDQMPWLHIQCEAMGFWHLKSLFSDILLGFWTQLIIWVVLWTQKLDVNVVDIFKLNILLLMQDFRLLALAATNLQLRKFYVVDNNIVWVCLQAIATRDSFRNKVLLHMKYDEMASKGGSGGILQVDNGAYNRAKRPEITWSLGFTISFDLTL